MLSANAQRYDTVELGAGVAERPHSASEGSPGVLRLQPCATTILFWIASFYPAWCFGIGDQPADVGCTSRAIAQAKAAISRAMAVVTTLLFFPAPISRR